jgi:DNA-binding response OmpR family regulator
MTNIPQNSSENILIVDDTTVNLRLLTRLLAGQGYKVRPATGGQQAVIAARSMAPDLVLLDIMMPDIDGYEVCRLLKNHHITRDVPIIFISALDETVDKINGFKAGGVDYITKPFQPEEVLARVKTHLTLRRLHRQLEVANQTLQQQNRELETRNAELKEALATIKTLSGIVPICAWCHTKIQDESGQWVRLENYIESRSHAEFTHGICPACKEQFKAESAGLKPVR